MKFRSCVRFQKEKNKTLISNIQNGKSIFVSNECLGYIEDFVHSNTCIKKFAENFLNLDDKVYIEKLINTLIEFEIIEDDDTKDTILINRINLSWDITNECNLHCTHCCISAGDKKRGKELTTKELITIADKIIDLNPYSICISGGEPLIRKDFKQIIEYISKRYTGNLKLMTNAVLIDMDMARFINEHFVSVDVSIDGIDENTCSVIRGPGVFDKIINGIQLLKECGNISIVASMLIFKDTENLRAEFTELCESKLGVYPIVRFFDDYGRGKENSKRLSLEKKKEIDVNLDKYMENFTKRGLHKKAPRVFSCQGAYTQFQIDQKGDLFPCASLMDTEFSMGNVLNIHNLKEYILKEDFKKTLGYANFEKYKPYNLTKCSNCNKNLLCFTCVREVIRNIEKNNIDNICKWNKKILDMYWRS